MTIIFFKHRRRPTYSRPHLVHIALNRNGSDKNSKWTMLKNVITLVVDSRAIPVRLTITDVSLKVKTFFTNSPII